MSNYLYSLYDSLSDFNTNINVNNNITNNNQYRNYVTRNGNKIIQENNNSHASKSHIYGVHNNPDNHLVQLKNKSNTPFLYDSINDMNHPYGYETNMLKEKHLFKIRNLSGQKNRYSNGI